jgi:hypothetical protein
VFKLFTLEGATRLLPVVETHLATLQEAVHDAAALRAAASTMRDGSVAFRNLALEVSFVAEVAHDAKAELDRLGVEVTDAEHGAVSFPAELGGEVVSLTWRRGQDAITHYRRLNGDGRVLPVEQEIGRRVDHPSG